MSQPDILTLPIVFSDHALMRYRRRCRRPATTANLNRTIAEGKVRLQPPADVWELERQPADAFLITTDAVFPLMRTSDNRLLALTCLRRNRLSKADRRARRDLAREERWDAA